MNAKLPKRFQELIDQLKALFKELATLQAENERLRKENIKLREEVSLLRLYVDTYLQEGESRADLKALDLLSSNAEPEVSEEAMDFFNSLPQSFNFSELFELAELLGVDKQQMKGYMAIYLRENMMRQHGTRVEKTGNKPEYWKRPLGQKED